MLLNQHKRRSAACALPAGSASVRRWLAWLNGVHRPDGAVAECDPVALIRKLVELGHIPFRVENLGQGCHFLIEALTR
jgi:hypothetical protein